MRVSILFLLLISSPALTAGQGNLLSNGGFDVDVQLWILFPGTAETLEHDPLDANGSAQSGSAAIVHSGSAGGDGYIWQCVQGLTSTERYDAGVSIHMPFPQSAAGEARIRVRWYSGACNGLISETEGPVVANLPFPVLFVASTLSDVTPPANTQSAHVQLVFDKIETNGSTAFYFDEAFFRSASRIFADGFESGNTSAWSFP